MIQVQNPLTLSLSKGRSFFRVPHAEQGQGFDKLSLDGFGGEA